MNLNTSYLGMKLRTPLVPSASPLSERLDGVKRMEDAGAAAVVFHSLFEEHLGQESKSLSHVEKHGYDSVAELQGSMSQKNWHWSDPTAFERAQYVRGISTAQRTVTDQLGSDFI